MSYEVYFVTLSNKHTNTCTSSHIHFHQGPLHFNLQFYICVYIQSSKYKVALPGFAILHFWLQNGSNQGAQTLLLQNIGRSRT